ncbi:cupin domain-containing protein [Halioxenophilus sp. WMMB6]|uniref:cupin domain-containing protein n=1 Tax=Halioxenophilus sp. WMMB6 TaxID=3073815 RepID=UPI00295EFC6B|nr:cupin domain-containing protein [Halioxenophilus sp. WMMB6]
MNVGERLRQMRQAKGLSQRELAKLAGVTNSTISLIEQNRVSPSVASLKKVLDGIPMTLSEFFTLDVQANEANYFYSPQQQPDIGSDGLHYFLVGADHKDRKITLLREVIEPGADSGADLITHDGEECGIVIDGEVELTIGDVQRVLVAGEGYYFDTRTPHRFRNRSDKTVIIISASTPVTF